MELHLRQEHSLVPLQNQTQEVLRSVKPLNSVASEEADPYLVQHQQLVALVLEPHLQAVQLMTHIISQLISLRLRGLRNQSRPSKRKHQRRNLRR